MTKKQRDAQQKRILEKAATDGLPTQFTSMEDINAVIDLMDRGYLDGIALRDGQRRIINVGGAEITGLGRKRLDQLANVSLLDRLKQDPVITLLVVIGIVVAYLAAFTENLGKIKSGIGLLRSPTSTNSSR